MVHLLELAPIPDRDSPGQTTRIRDRALNP
jgi:hypothetical protein